MKIETGTVTIVRITGIEASHSLDPIRVTLDDIEPGKGRITIECWGKAWASYWGGMGSQTIAQFFVGCNNGYLIDNLAYGQQLERTRYSADALVKLAEKTICERRRSATPAWLDLGGLEKDAARELFNDVGDLAYLEDPMSCWSQSTLLTSIFGEEWFHYIDGRAAEPNPEYVYLDRIVTAVREALQCLQASKAEQTEEVAA